MSFTIPIIFIQNLIGLLDWSGIGSFQETKALTSSPLLSENLCKGPKNPLPKDPYSFRKNLFRSYLITAGIPLSYYKSSEKTAPRPEPTAPETPTNEKEDKHRQGQIETQDSSDVEEEISLYNGLPNFGNTCFANSLIQSLFHIESFREGVIQAYNDRSHANNLLDLLAELFIQMKTGSNNRGTLYRKFLDKIFDLRNGEFKIGIQGDSSALFRAIVEELCGERDIKEIPYLKILTAPDLNITKKCPKCDAEKPVKENIRPLEVTDIHFLKEKSRTFFKMQTDFRRCTQCNTSGQLECCYLLEECPDILAIRIQDKQGSRAKTDLLQSFMIFEGIEKKRVEYKFISGVFNTAKGERGFHSVEVSQIGGTWYQISDQSCREISRGRVDNHPKILFYQRQ